MAKKSEKDPNVPKRKVNSTKRPTHSRTTGVVVGGAVDAVVVGSGVVVVVVVGC